MNYDESEPEHKSWYRGNIIGWDIVLKPMSRASCTYSTLWCDVFETPFNPVLSDFKLSFFCKYAVIIADFCINIRIHLIFVQLNFGNNIDLLPKLSVVTMVTEKIVKLDLNPWPQASWTQAFLTVWDIGDWERICNFALQDLQSCAEHWRISVIDKWVTQPTGW